MSKKTLKIAALIDGCMLHPTHDTRYVAYFRCFNAQNYYDAHDVLEDLWLRDKPGPNGNFYKGLIQLAGAFVHLQKNRLGPASKLFELAINCLRHYPSPHEDLDVSGICQLAHNYDLILTESSYTSNPWSTENPPRIELLP